MSSEDMYAKRFLKLGAKGFLSKQESNEEFIKAVQTVISGDLYLSKYMIKTMTNDALHGQSGNVFEKLTPREFEIMTYFLRGLGSKEVSNITQLHSSTIGTYKFKIFDKLGINNVLELQELAKIHGVKGDEIK
jgi:DNA-binding NarL/FixJ family response regulator